MTLPVKPINEIEEKSEVGLDDKILILDADTEEARLASKDELKGDKGDKGDPGTPGKDGDDGVAATVTVGATSTGAAGTPASVTNSGTSSAAVFNFTIPKGDQGNPGATGNGISTITETTSGKVHTVTITETNGNTSVFTVSDGADGTGSGDVVGPNSAIDGNVALFDGNTGKLIKDGGALPSVINNLTSTSTTDSLSANQGKVLNDKITTLQARGRFLSNWNATTGLPVSFPEDTPYTYKTGDYFDVTVVGTTNYKPNGSSYAGTASTTVETDTLAVGDTYIYDGSVWLLQLNHNITTTFATISGQPSDNTNLASALNNKQDKLVSGTNIKTVNSTSLLGSGNVAVQETLVSGTNIKTVNSTSLLGSGNIAVQPTLVSGTNIKTINSTSLLGSGNVSVQALHKTLSLSLTVAGWSNKTQTKTATGVTASNTVIVAPAPASMTDYTAAKIYCSAQGSNSLTFTCDTVPSSAITVNVVILD